MGLYHLTAFGLTNENMKNSALRKKQLLNLAAWNVRTTNDSVNSIRPEIATCTAIIDANIMKTLDDNLNYSYRAHTTLKSMHLHCIH